MCYITDMETNTETSPENLIVAALVAVEALLSIAETVEDEIALHQALSAIRSLN